MDEIKGFLYGLLTCTSFFIAVYLVAWCGNGIYSFHFDLASLQNFYMLIVGKQLGIHGLDSIFNTIKGEMPPK